MKKFLKVFFITLSSLLVLVIAGVSIVLWFVFTPEKLTPIIRKQAGNFISCKSEIGEVELTFFSTFPHFGLKVNRFLLVNHVPDAPSDTLINVGALIGGVDIEALWKNNKLILSDISMLDGNINIFSDEHGNTNYDIFISDTTTVTSAETESEMTLSFIDIGNIDLENINLTYFDNSIKLKSSISDLDANISGTISYDSICGNMTINKSNVSVEYDGEKYLQDASVQLNIPAEIILSKQHIRFNTALASVNDLAITINGTVENDTINKNIITDINYDLKSWQVKNILDLVPPSYSSYLEGINVEGLLSSDGKITGIYNDSVMPLFDIHLLMKNGDLKYSGFTLPLGNINGDINIYTDLKNDSISYVRINDFEAQTPKSTFKTNGDILNLFSDIYCKLTTDASLTLDEFNSMIPSSMKVKMKGNVKGKVKSDFSMSQIEKLQIEKMKLSGNLSMTNLSVTYDSIWIKTNRSKMEFALPNNKASKKEAKFAYTKITTGDFEAGMLEGINVLLKNAIISLETSDVRDTTRIPDLICSFNMDSLYTSMDSITLSVKKPFGKASVSPRKSKPDQPKIKLAYNSLDLKAVYGQNSAEIKKVNIDTDILNDSKQKDIFLQWLVKGFIDMDKGVITTSALNKPIQIPSIKMDFEPQKFNIKESRIIIDKSDFSLTGEVHNILSYFRGDSILKGKFNFSSTNTDALQLMNLTNGIGTEKDSLVSSSTDSSEESLSSLPYMVPKGIEMVLSTNIKQASFGIDTATNITGDLQINDGILVLNELSFTTPAAKMQLTAMYRTPRKNHLFIGLDYHMMDIEISELLKMIPDIDSMMPMLRSFGGKGEFHIAAECYTDSAYNIKNSTILGASSITGKDLVLMDGETFSEIAKTLMFNKKTVNKVDTLSAEFTIFKKEIDIYPFLIVMDKYKAVVAGRHNLDMTFDYHISVVDCPLPVKLGIDIKGNMDDLKYKLAACKYAEFYRPASRHVVENKQLDLRKKIREALTQKVKD